MQYRVHWYDTVKNRMASCITHDADLLSVLHLLETVKFPFKVRNADTTQWLCQDDVPTTAKGGYFLWLLPDESYPQTAKALKGRLPRYRKDV